jgi:mercuric reductase
MSDCCSTQAGPETPSAHLVIIGGGSAAFSAALKANELGAGVTLINDGLPIGGTCVNVGCVPSKTLIRAAESHHRASHQAFHGIESSSKVGSFKAIIAQKRALVRELRQAKYIDVVSDLPDIRIVEGRAGLVDGKTVEVDGEPIAADRILIATGASTFVPPIPGLEETGYLTNETAFELEELPESLIVIGGRYIALECAQMFARLGSRVTVLQRSSRILPTEADDLTDALTGYLEQEGIEIVTGVSITRVADGGMGTRVEAVIDGAEGDGAEKTFEAAQVLLATGRRPNTSRLGLEELGIERDPGGFLTVDETLRTSGEGIYGAGDVIGEPMFVYTAAYEGALAAENAITGSSRDRDYAGLPWVIFTDPQVAGVGLDEEQASEKGIDADVATLPLSHVPRAIAARDVRGFIKLIRDRGTDRLIGARILAPEGSELLMEISLAIRHGITANELASAFHPYLTLSEGVKLAAITFGKDVSKLSCCAS